MDYVVYMLHCPEMDILYKGYTQDIETRLRDHNSGKSKYTKKCSPNWVVVFMRTFESKTEALQYEHMLKRQNRGYLEWVIQQPYNEAR